jgi:hypothetical protein
VFKVSWYFRDVAFQCDHSRQVAEHAKLLAKIEARWRQWLSGEASPYHASDTDQVAGVEGGVAYRSDHEERHGWSEDDHGDQDVESQSDCDAVERNVPTWAAISIM